jgi:hypothetical protein
MLAGGGVWGQAALKQLYHQAVLSGYHPVIPVRIKPCSGPCAQSYPITHYWSDAGAPDGRMSRCPKCEKQARAARKEAKANGELDGAVQTTNGRVVHFTEEERARRSALAKQLHAEGRFGGKVIGARGGQAPQRHRIFDSVLEHFRQPDQQQLVIKAIESNLKGKNKMARLAAVRELRAAESQQDERLSRDRGGAVDPTSLTQEELEEFVMQGLQARMAEMIERGEVPADLTLDYGSVEEIQ